MNTTRFTAGRSLRIAYQSIRREYLAGVLRLGQNDPPERGTHHRRDVLRPAGDGKARHVIQRIHAHEDVRPVFFGYRLDRRAECCARRIFLIGGHRVFQVQNDGVGPGFAHLLRAFSPCSRERTESSGTVS